MIATSGELAKIVGAQLRGPLDLPVERLVTDSRQAGPGDLFVPVVGLQHDGHDFVAGAWQRGAQVIFAAPGALAARGLEPPAGSAVLEVLDPRAAYGQVGAWWRARFPALVMVGITGSLGKTSTKELAAQILSRRGPIIANQDSFNNEVGVPATLLRLGPEHWAAIQEMGMRGPGQIAELCELVRPALGLITNIGHSHLGVLGSRQAIAEAKGELLDCLGRDGTALLNADDPHSRSLAPRHSGRIVWFGQSAESVRLAEVRGSDVRLQGLSGSRFVLTIAGGPPVEVRLPLPGPHMVANALAAAAIGHALGFTATDIGDALSQPARLAMRGEVLTLANGARLINDAYNAAPESVAAALGILAAEPTTGRRIAVLGGMAELGATSTVEHLRLGAAAGQVVDLLVCVGPAAAEIAEGAAGGRAKVIALPDVPAVAEWLARELRDGDLALLKASRVYELESVLTGLEVRA